MISTGESQSEMREIEHGSVCGEGMLLGFLLDHSKDAYNSVCVTFGLAFGYT